MSTKPLTLVLLLGLAAAQAHAMPILQFGRMNPDDAAGYVTTMVEGTAKKLRASGHPDQAKQIVDLFKNSTSHGGVSQFAHTLGLMQGDNDRSATNPNNRKPLHDVEDAMAETLHQNGFDISAAELRTFNQAFAPMFPPRAHVGGT